LLSEYRLAEGVDHFLWLNRPGLSTRRICDDREPGPRLGRDRPQTAPTAHQRSAGSAGPRHASLASTQSHRRSSVRQHDRRCHSWNLGSRPAKYAVLHKSLGLCARQCRHTAHDFRRGPCWECRALSPNPDSVGTSILDTSLSELGVYFFDRPSGTSVAQSPRPYTVSLPHPQTTALTSPPSQPLN
jgi:hypothetical protein